jgi:hypothetical protein
MDAWASSLGEGTQDIQKLVIIRELMSASRKGGGTRNGKRTGRATDE